MGRFIYLAIMKYDEDSKILFKFTDDNSKNLIARISIISDEKENNGIQDQTDIINTFKNINNDILNNITIQKVLKISLILL